MLLFSRTETLSEAQEASSGSVANSKLETCLLLAKSLYQGRRYREALAMVEGAVSRFPAEIELLHLRGLCLQATSNLPAAFATFMSVLNIDPKHAPSLCCVGNIYKGRGMLQEALAAFQQAYAVVQADAAATANSGAAAQSQQQGTSAAGSTLGAAVGGVTLLEVAQALSALHTEMGSRAKASGLVNDTLAHYQRALEICPSYAPTYYHMGVLYSEGKQLEAALTWYQQAVRLCPTYAEAHCNIGVICKERGELETAIASYERALECAPNFAIVKNNIAIALTDLGTRVKLAGHLAEGMALYERALAYNPRYADALYNLGVAHGESGQVDKAIFMYEMAVQCNPACAEAHNNLGVIHKERDNLERAMECYTAALTVRPNFPQSLNNMGVIYTCQGRAQEALTLLTAAIAACPSYAEAYNNLGVLQRDVGAIPQALASYSKCLELAPDSRNAGQNRLLALNYIRYGDEEEVCQAHAEWGKRFANLFRPLPALGPGDRDLSLMRPLRVGYISPDLFTHSVSYFAEAPLAHHNTPGKALQKQQQQQQQQQQAGVGEAFALLPQQQGQLQLQQRLYRGHHSPQQQQQQQQLHRAVVGAAVGAGPANDSLQGADAQGLSRKHSDAPQEGNTVINNNNNNRSHSPSSSASVPCSPSYTATSSHAAASCQLHEPFSSSCSSARGSEGSQPLQPLQQGAGAAAAQPPLQQGGRRGSSHEGSPADSPAAQRVRSKQRRGDGAAGAGAGVEEGAAGGSMQAEAQEGQESTPPPGQPQPQQGTPKGKEVRRRQPGVEATNTTTWGSSSCLEDAGSGDADVADLAADVDFSWEQQGLGRRGVAGSSSGRGAAGRVWEEGLRHGEAGEVQHVVYCCAPKRDGKTARLKAAVQAAHGIWREVTQLPEPDLAALVRQDEIDILVELTGHTANNRLGTMAMRPAPIQVTWIGYPNSTGLEAVDYRITDALSDPLDTRQAYVEELVRMPGGTFLCYTPAHDAPAVSPTPALTSGFVTFGSFNNLAKVTPEVLKTWARILSAVPNSRLLLKNKPFACETARTHVLNLLAAEGVEAWRVDLLPLAAANSDHLATYALMDISLDTFPYAGTTTTCESMYMGVPCLTLAGRGHAHNVGVSLLTSVGLHQEWVAYSVDQYVQLAVQHASDLPRLAALRQRLRSTMLASRLCDAPFFVRELEGVYRRMWMRYVRQQHAVRPGHAVQQGPAVQPQGCQQQQQGVVQGKAGASGAIGGGGGVHGMRQMVQHGGRKGLGMAGADEQEGAEVQLVPPPRHHQHRQQQQQAGGKGEAVHQQHLQPPPQRGEGYKQQQQHRQREQQEQAGMEEGQDDSEMHEAEPSSSMQAPTQAPGVPWQQHPQQQQQQQPSPSKHVASPDLDASGSGAQSMDHLDDGDVLAVLTMASEPKHRDAPANAAPSACDNDTTTAMQAGGDAAANTSKSAPHNMPGSTLNKNPGSTPLPLNTRTREPSALNSKQQGRPSSLAPDGNTRSPPSQATQAKPRTNHSNVAAPYARLAGASNVAAAQPPPTPAVPLPPQQQPLSKQQQHSQGLSKVLVSRPNSPGTPGLLDQGSPGAASTSP